MKFELPKMGGPKAKGGGEASPTVGKPGGKSSAKGGPPLFVGGDSVEFDGFTPPNFLPADYLKLKNSHLRFDYLLVLAALVGFCFLLFNVVWSVLTLIDLNNEADMLEEQAAGVVPQKKQYEERLAAVQANVYAAQRFLNYPSQRFLLTNYLYDVATNLPASAFVAKMDVKFSSETFRGTVKVPLQTSNRGSRTSSSVPAVTRLVYTVNSTMVVQGIDEMTNSQAMAEFASRLTPPGVLLSSSGALGERGLAATIAYTYETEIGFTPPESRRAPATEPTASGAVASGAGVSGSGARPVRDRNAAIDLE
jgi:hypothetical protein